MSTPFKVLASLGCLSILTHTLLPQKTLTEEVWVPEVPFFSNPQSITQENRWDAGEWLEAQAKTQHLKTRRKFKSNLVYVSGENLDEAADKIPQKIPWKRLDPLPQKPKPWLLDLGIVLLLCAILTELIKTTKPQTLLIPIVGAAFLIPLQKDPRTSYTFTIENPKSSYNEFNYELIFMLNMLKGEIGELTCRNLQAQGYKAGFLLLDDGRQLNNRTEKTNALEIRTTAPFEILKDCIEEAQNKILFTEA
jgi:hypothetical protein